MKLNDITSLLYHRQRFLKLETDGSFMEAEAKNIIQDIAMDTGDFNDIKFNRNQRNTSFYKRVINQVATFSFKMLASLLVSHLTNPSQRWFFMEIDDGDVKATREEAIWIRKCEDIMFKSFSKSKIHQALHNVYYEGINFGSGVMYKKMNKGQSIYLPLTVGQYYFDRDENGDVNVLVRRMTMNTEAIISQFGYDSLPEHVKIDFNSGNRNSIHTVIHSVEPNLNFLPDWDNPYHKPFISTYYIHGESQDKDKFLEQKGMIEFPYYVLRWDQYGVNVYGTGIGRSVLGDVRMLQGYERDLAKASKKKVDPPMKADPGMKTVEKNVGAGKVTYTAVPEGFTPLFNVNYDVQPAILNIQRLEDRIKQSSFLDIFFAMMVNDKTKSATEAAEIASEKFVVLGAVTDRIRTEFMDKIVEDKFAEQLRLGNFPTIPDSLSGKELKISYKSILLQSMEMTDLVSIERYMQFTQQQAALDPVVQFKLDQLGINETYATKLGLNKENIRSNKEAEKMFADSQEGARLANQESTSKATLNNAKAVNELSSANTTGENALADLMGG